MSSISISLALYAFMYTMTTIIFIFRAAILSDLFGPGSKSYSIMRWLASILLSCSISTSTRYGVLCCFKATYVNSIELTISISSIIHFARFYFAIEFLMFKSPFSADLTMISSVKSIVQIIHVFYDYFNLFIVIALVIVQDFYIIFHCFLSLRSMSSQLLLIFILNLYFNFITIMLF